MSKHDGGKGDTPRPFAVSLEKFEENFDLIFGKKATKPQPVIEPIPFAGMVNIEEDKDGYQSEDH